MRRINPRSAKLHRSYTAHELAERLDVHKNTVRHWIKGGLPVVDGTRPVLILGSDFQAWWGRQRKAAKRPCQPGQMYCFKCREPKAPALGMVDYVATNAATGNLKALPASAPKTKTAASKRKPSRPPVPPSSAASAKAAPPPAGARSLPQ
ncbi:helix-turn-helix domain-containing protein [Erythrobacter sp.]|uniref:helix-turn-helix domain-containing protein n=1 Tax=Erythrobacter sp. TaxID=1042 RepID=UPI0025DF86F4|nr:helix-turn-helix domain-containing protein [Erythrobacter sp.]